MEGSTSTEISTSGISVSVSENLLLESDFDDYDFLTSSSDRAVTAELQDDIVADSLPVLNDSTSDEIDRSSVKNTSTTMVVSSMSQTSTNSSEVKNTTSKMEKFISNIESNDELMTNKISQLGKDGAYKEWSFSRLRRVNSSSNTNCAVKISVRIRPFTSKEIELDSKRIVATNYDKIVLVNPSAFEADPDIIAAAALVSGHTNQWTKEFRFDERLWSNDPSDKNAMFVDQRKMFTISGLQMVDRAMEGGSIVCCAYGSTGSGKSHTMFGSILENSHSRIDKNSMGVGLSSDFPVDYGLIPRVFCDVVNRIGNNSEMDADTKVTISFVEIYNEKICDLLHPTDFEAYNCKVREKSGMGSYIENLTKTNISNVEDVLQTLTFALSRRVNRRKENNVSSRSHAFVTLEISPLLSSPTARKGKTSKDETIRVHMVDLASSESAVTSNSNKKYKEKKKSEMTLIRKSLSTLGFILKELGRGIPSRGLPFRDSVLTWLIKDALSGNCHASFISTISPSSISFEDTLSTLKYTRRLLQDKKEERIAKKKEITDKGNNNFNNNNINTNGNGSRSEARVGPSTGIVDKKLAKDLFRKIDKNGDGHISLLELTVIARDNTSEEGKMLHDLLGFPDHVRQEDGTKDKIVQIFADMHAGKDCEEVGIDTFCTYLEHHRNVMEASTSRDLKARNIVESLGGQKGTSAARDVLRQTISDPQQRLAKLNPYQIPSPAPRRGAMNNMTAKAIQNVVMASSPSSSMLSLEDLVDENDEFTEVASQIYAAIQPEYPSSACNRKHESVHDAEMKSQNEQSPSRNERKMITPPSLNQLAATPLSSSSSKKKDDEMTTKGGPLNSKTNSNSSQISRSLNFKEAYRVLQGQLVESQIEMEGIRTDRDSLMLELQNAKNIISASTFKTPTDVIANREEMLKLLETSTTMNAQVVDLKDLVFRKEEKVGELMEQLARVKDENAILRHDLGGLHASIEERDVKVHVLTEENTRQQGMMQTLLGENTKLKEDLDFHMAESSKLMGNLEIVQSNSKLKIDDLYHQTVVLRLEKDHSEGEKSKLTEDLIILQQQFNAVKDQLDKAKEAAEKYSPENYHKLENEIADVKGTEDKMSYVLSNCDFGESNDDVDISVMLKIVESNLEPYVSSNICKRIIEFISKARVAIQKKLTTHLENTCLLLENANGISPSSTPNFTQVELETQLNEKDEKQARNMDLLQQKLLYYQKTTELLQTQLESERLERLNLPSDGSNISTGPENGFDVLRKEVNAVPNRTSVESPTRDIDMEKEYTSLWLAVNELSKLDAEKDDAIKELLNEREAMNSKVKGLEKQNEELKNDMLEIDNQLFSAAGENYDVDESVDYSALINDEKGTNISSHTRQLVNNFTKALSPNKQSVRQSARRSSS